MVVISCVGSTKCSNVFWSWKERDTGPRWVQVEGRQEGRLFWQQQAAMLPQPHVTPLYFNTYKIIFLTHWPGDLKSLLLHLPAQVKVMSCLGIPGALFHISSSYAMNTNNFLGEDLPSGYWFYYSWIHIYLLSTTLLSNLFTMSRWSIYICKRC